MDDQTNSGGADQGSTPIQSGSMPTPAPVAAEPQQPEKCSTCGNSASGGNCMPCGQGEVGCTCTPTGEAPTGGGMPPPTGGEQPGGDTAPVV